MMRQIMWGVQDWLESSFRRRGLCADYHFLCPSISLIVISATDKIPETRQSRLCLLGKAFRPVEHDEQDNGTAHLMGCFVQQFSLVIEFSDWAELHERRGGQRDSSLLQVRPRVPAAAAPAGSFIRHRSRGNLRSVRPPSYMHTNIA